VRVAEEHRHPQGFGDLGVHGQLLALVPGQRSAQLGWKPSERGDQRVADCLGGVPSGQVQQHREPGVAIDQGADRRPVLLPGDQIPFPMSRLRPVGGLGRALVDHRHLGQGTGAAGIGATMWLATPPAGAQPTRQLPGQPTQLGPVDRLVDLGTRCHCG
jgi:hypothetical protein